VTCLTLRDRQCSAYNCRTLQATTLGYAGPMTLKRPKSKLCMTACHSVAAQPQQPYGLNADITQQSQLSGAPLPALCLAQSAEFTLSAPPASDDLRERLAFRRSIELLVRSACSSGCRPPARCAGLRQVTLPNQVDRVGCYMRHHLAARSWADLSEAAVVWQLLMYSLHCEAQYCALPAHAEKSR
jgi:hypothetical protein